MTYFSVDVETTGLVPFVHDVTALSVVEIMTEEHMTCQLTEPEGGWHWDPDTSVWAKHNIPASVGLWPVFKPEIAVEGIARLLSGFPKPWTFVAWPTSMDYPFMQSIYRRAGIAPTMNLMPFHYRTFDVKSFIAGRYNVPLDADRDTINKTVGFELWTEPAKEQAHDPFYDALEQGRTTKRALDGQ